jgi:dTDP-4-amino-4,6-dideoxygalactose transaminase
MDKIKMADLPAQYREAHRYMEPTPEVMLNHGMYVGGSVIQKFEEDFAKYIGSKHAIGMSSGTDALTAAYACLVRSWAPGAKRLVITQANTFVATASAALRLPQTYVSFVDCDKDFQMDSEQLELTIQAAIDDDYHTIIVVPVHMYGMVGCISHIRYIINKYNEASLVEDASHAHGACDINGRRAGSYGDMAAFSCFPAKPLGAGGDAGVVTTDDHGYDRWLRSYQNCGRDSAWDEYNRVGFTYRLDAIQASILCGKLCCLDRWLARRSEIAQRYARSIMPHSGVRIPSVLGSTSNSAWYAYPLRISIRRKRENLLNTFERQSVPFKVYYPKIVPDTPAFIANPCVKRFAGVEGHINGWGRSKSYSEQLVCLPIHEFMTDEQVDFIAECINKETK